MVLSVWGHSDKEVRIDQDGLDNREPPGGLGILDIHRCSDKRFRAWWIVWLSSARRDTHTRGWGMVDILGIHGCSIQGVWGMDILGIHGCAYREFGAWWTSLDCPHSTCLLTWKSKVNITVLAMCGLQYINIHVFSPSILLALVLCAQWYVQRCSATLQCGSAACQHGSQVMAHSGHSTIDRIGHLAACWPGHTQETLSQTAPKFHNALFRCWREEI